MKNRKRNRIQGFDYSSDNLYFVTICVKDRVCCFGYVGTGRDLSVHHSNEKHSNENQSNEKQSSENHRAGVKMHLNEFGKIVKEQIEWLSGQYKYVEIHNYVVMPNHVHIIIEIDRNKLMEGTARELSVQDEEIKIKSLSSLMGAFKTTSSKIIHQAGFEDFYWQRSFHDHIIRNESSYQNISNYITLNPEKWLKDTFFENH